MAPKDSTYLPELSKVFSGEEYVLSWKEAAASIQSKTTYNVPRYVQSWLVQDTPSRLLLKSAPSFPKPSAADEKLFEAHTAPINVSPSRTDHYDIAEIKEDATWLSKELDLDKNQALRAAVLEWQSRPQLHLRSGYSEAELACLKTAFGDTNTADGDYLASAIKRDDQDFNTVTSRRRRILWVQFQEELGLVDTYLVLAEKSYYDTQLGATPSLPVDIVPHTDACLGSLVTVMEEALKGPEWSVIDDDSVYIWHSTKWFLAASLMRLLILCVRQSSRPSSQALQSWLRLMVEARFLADLEPSSLLNPTQVVVIQNLVALTAIAFIDPAATIGSIPDPPPDLWLRDSELVADLHTALFICVEKAMPPTVAPAFAWALVMGQMYMANNTTKDAQDARHPRRSIEGVDAYDSAYGRRNSSNSNSMPFEDAVNAIWQVSSMQNPSEYLIRCTSDIYDAPFQLGTLANVSEDNSTIVFQTLSSQIIQEVVLAYLDLHGYDDKILTPQIAILNPPSLPVGRWADLAAPGRTFLYNDILREQIFELSSARFPYEALPFLRLCHALAHAHVFDPEGVQYIASRLKTLKSYTHVAKDSLESYHTIREDENLNLVALSTHVDVLPHASARFITDGRQQHAVMILPADTVGEVISDSHPPVIRWRHELPGLALLGQWLELYYDGILHHVLSAWDSADDVAAEIVALFTTLLETTMAQKNCSHARLQELTSSILIDASSNMTQGRDITSFIFEVLEQQLQAYRRRPSSTFNTGMLCACLNYLRVLLTVEPDRVWTSLPKTSLIFSSSSEPLLTAIVSGVEQFNGNTELIEAAQSLYAGLVENAFSRRSGNISPTTTSSATHSRLPQLAALKNCSAVLEAMTGALLDVFELVPTWYNISRPSKMKILRQGCGVFHKVLVICDTGDSNTKIFNCFVPAAKAIIERLRLQSALDAKASTVIRQLSLHVNLDETFYPSQGAEAHLCSLLTLVNSILYFTTKFDQPSEPLEAVLFDVVSLFIRKLTTIDLGYTDSVFHILRTLLSARLTEKHTSLLSHIGQASCIDFVNYLLGLQSIHDTEVATRSWQILKLCINRSQQWLAVVILTGAIPEKLRTCAPNASQVCRGKLVIDRAADFMSQIDSEDTHLMAAILEFVRQMQQDWSWTFDTLMNRQQIFPSLVTFATGPSSTRIHDELQYSEHHHLVALITDLASVHLHYAKSQKDVKSMKHFIPLVDWLTKNAIDVGSYNRSLHENLGKNFDAKFGLELRDFRTSRLCAHSQPRAMYYDMITLDQVLADEPSWRLSASKTQSSFSAEVERANRNLAVVESELTLLHAFEQFCIEHCTFFAQSNDLQVTMAHVVHRCLEANTKQRLSEQIFEHLVQTRADIALALTRCIAEKQPKGSDFRNLLPAAWNCALARNENWEHAIDNDDLEYWRTSMSTVLLALQFHLGRSWQPLASNTSATTLLHHTEHSISYVLEIATIVVGKGIGVLTTNLQDQYQAQKQSSKKGTTALVEQRDVALVVNILQTILRQARLPDFASQLSERLISTGCIQSTLLLYSWSHLLVSPSTDNNPVYAEYAAQMLLSLSTLPAVAEELAVEGILGRVLTARVTQVLQKIPDGVSNLDKRPHALQLYRVWAEGLLSICLNLLHSVAAPVAAEITLFLNQFPNQLSRASRAFSPRPGEFITLSLARETSSLALISYIIDRYRDAGASAAVNPASLEALVGYEERRKSLGEDIRELTTLTNESLAAKIVPTSEQELQWVKNGELRKKVQTELKTALTCLTRGEEVDEGKS